MRDFFADQDVGTQIDVARFHFAVDQARRARERERGLGDVVARIGENARTKIIALLLRTVRADEHAVAAGFADRFHHHFFEVREDVVALLVVAHLIRLDVWQDGRLRRGNSE